MEQPLEAVTYLVTGELPSGVEEIIEIDADQLSAATSRRPHGQMFYQNKEAFTGLGIANATFSSR